MNNSKKILAITGPFADINFGDYAMLINNIYDLHIKNIVLFSYDRHFMDIIRDDFLQDYNVKIIDVFIKDDLKELLKKHYAPTPFELMSLIVNYDDLVGEIENIDTLIVSGGGYFNGLWSMPHRIDKLLKIIAPILVANQLGKKIYLTGNSFGPFGEDGEFFSSLFNCLNNTIFSCRDNLYSPMWMKQIGIDSSNLEYVPDDLFSINRSLLEFKTNIAIKAEKYIVIESYLPTEFFKKNVDTLIDFSKTIHDRYDLSIVFLPFNLGHGGLDQALFLNTVLNNFEYYDLSSKGYLPIQDAVEIIKKAKLVISSRYHAFVLALSYGIPAINILRDVLGDKRYYYNKSFGILREVLKGILFDQKFYLQSNYLDALNTTLENYKTIIDYQTSKYNDVQYSLNKDRLVRIRHKFLKKIIDGTHEL